MARDVFAVRDELDPRDHVPGGWRRETMVATVPWRSRSLRPRSRRGGCPCRGHVAIGGWVFAGERASRSGRRRRRRTAPEAGSVQLPSTAFESLDGPARLEPVREVRPFTAVRAVLGTGFATPVTTGTVYLVALLVATAETPFAAAGIFGAFGLARAVPLIVVGRCLARSSAQTHECLAWLSWSRPVPDLCGRIFTSFLVGVVVQYWNLAPFG